MNIKWFNVPMGDDPPHCFGEINGKVRISLECAQGMFWAYRIDREPLVGPYLGFEGVKLAVSRELDTRAYFEQFRGDE